MNNYGLLYNINALLTIAYRDIIKFVRDRRRLFISLVFPFIFIVILGESFGSSFQEASPVNYELFIFTGILGQTLFQSTASGLISLVQDREEDFAQELFIAPVPRFIIILGKILGESVVAMFQGLGILVLGVFIGAEIGVSQLIALIPVFFVATFLGGSFGVLVLSNLSEPRAANQIFPLLLLPQFFLSGAIAPFARGQVPDLLYALHLATPMTYAVDFCRQLLYSEDQIFRNPEQIGYVANLEVTVAVALAMFLAFLGIGTYTFVRNERNK